MSSSSSSSARSLHHDHSVLTAVPLINCLLIAVANELVIGPPPPPPLATSLHNRLAAVSLLFGVSFLLPFRDHRTNQLLLQLEVVMRWRWCHWLPLPSFSIVLFSLLAAAILALFAIQHSEITLNCWFGNWYTLLTLQWLNEHSR